MQQHTRKPAFYACCKRYAERSWENSMNQGKKSLINEDREFRRYYNLHLKPLEQHYESLRREAVKETNLRIIAALTTWLATVTAIGYLAPLGDGFTTALVIALALLAGLGLGLWAWSPAQAHVDQLKEQILPHIISFFGNLRYQSEPDFDPRQYRDWKVLPVFDESYSEDLIEGCYHGVPLKLAEIKLIYRKTRSSGGNSVTEHITKFEGLMLAFKLGEDYPGVTLIHDQDSKMIDHLDETLAKIGSGSGFKVLATNDATGAKLADAHFLERLAEVATQFKARHLIVGLHANQLVMMIRHKGNYFEMSHRNKTNFAKDAKRVREQLGRVFSIVDLLHLEGASVEDGKDAQLSQHPSFAKLSELNNSARPDAGSWGCLIFFIMFAVSMTAYLILLETEWLLWWSAFGGLLMSSGIFQTIRGLWQRSALTLIFGITLLIGTLSVLYFHLSPDTQELIRPWMLFF